jgi:hypothetical protein
MTMRDDDLTTRTGGAAGITDEDDPSAIERDIERTRADMSETLEAIQQKLSPSHLVDQALGYFKAGPGTMMSSLSDIAVRNPIPLTLIGLGIGWVAVAGLRSGPSSSRRHYGDAAGYQGQPDQDAGSYGGSMSRMSDSARNAASRAYSSVREGASGLAEQAASHIDTGRISGLVSRATSPVLGLGETQPLLLGAIGLAIGAVIGASFSTTPVENRLMGSTRDDLVRRARDMGEEQLHRVQAAAQRTMDAVREEVSAEGLTPGQAAESLTDKVTRVAEAGYQAAKEELKKEG